MEIDAIKERSGDFCTVGLDLTGRATALPHGIAKESTRTGIQGADEEEF
jgi:hypothetical protein